MLTDGSINGTLNYTDIIGIFIQPYYLFTLLLTEIQALKLKKIVMIIRNFIVVL